MLSSLRFFLWLTSLYLRLNGKTLLKIKENKAEYRCVGLKPSAAIHMPIVQKMSSSSRNSSTKKQLHLFESKIKHFLQVSLNEIPAKFGRNLRLPSTKYFANNSRLLNVPLHRVGKGHYFKKSEFNP